MIHVVKEQLVFAMFSFPFQNQVSIFVYLKYWMEESNALVGFFIQKRTIISCLNLFQLVKAESDHRLVVCGIRNSLVGRFINLTFLPTWEKCHHYPKKGLIFIQFACLGVTSPFDALAKLECPEEIIRDPL